MVQVSLVVQDTTSVQTGTPLLNTLRPDDSFWAGDFAVKVTQASGQGTFNGKGVIEVPYLDRMRLNVILKDVRVNEACQMVAGEVKVEGVGAALIPESVANALNDILAGLEQLDNALERLEQVFGAVGSIVNTNEALNGYLSPSWNPLDGMGPLRGQYPHLDEGVIGQLDAALACFAAASIGATPMDTCTQMMANALASLHTALTQMFEADYQVEFEAYAGQLYGLDKLVHPVLEEAYQHIRVAGGDYAIPWKSVMADTSDIVLLDIDLPSWPEDLTVEDNKGVSIPIFEVDGRKAVRVRHGGQLYGQYPIYPVQSKYDSVEQRIVKKYAGRLNVATYPNNVMKVVLVPVLPLAGPVEAATVQGVLSDIYKGAVTEVAFEVRPPLQAPGFSGVLDGGEEEGGTAQYSDGMWGIVDALAAVEASWGAGEDGTHYVFVVEDAQADGLLGFMPHGRPYGFVVRSHHNSTAHLANTIAHELGHGAASLEHIFEEFEFEDGSTDNLMDYGGGAALLKRQWDHIHRPVTNSAGGSAEDAESARVLPCSLPKDMAILTPDRIGILVPQEGNPKLIGKFYSGDQVSRKGTLSHIAYDQSNAQVYAWAEVANAQQSHGYTLNGQIGPNRFPVSADENIYAGDPVSRKYVMGGLKTSPLGCECEVVEHDESTTPLSISSTGVYLTNTGQQRVALPLDPMAGRVISTIRAHPSHCNEDDPRNLLSDIFWEGWRGGEGRSIGTSTNIGPMIGGAKASFAANGYKVAIYYYDHGPTTVLTDDVLQIHRPGQPVETHTTEQSISNELQKYNEGNFGAGIDFAMLVDRMHTAGQVRARFHLGIKPGHLTPFSDITPPTYGVPLAGDRAGSDDLYQKDFQKLLRERFNELPSLNTAWAGSLDSQGNDGELRVDGTANFFTWGGFAVAELGHLVRTAEVNPGLWDPSRPDYSPKILHIYSPMAGVVDQGLITVKDLYDAVGLVTEIVKEPVQTVSGIYQHFAGMAPGDLLYSLTLEEYANYWQNYQQAPPGPQKQYHGTRGTIFTVATAAKAASGGFVAAALLGAALENLGGTAVRVAKRLEEIASGPLKSNISGLSSVEKKGDFLDDFEKMAGSSEAGLDGVIGQFNAKPGMVGAWEVAIDNNLPVPWRTNLEFLDRLRNVWDFTFVNGNNAKLPNIALEATPLSKMTNEVTTQMRSIFDSTVKRDFLIDLGNDPQVSSMLRMAGFTDIEIPQLTQRLRDGNGITGYQVHHKVPLNLGGSNDFSNLVLMKQSPYHAALTSFQNSQINIPIGQTQTLDFPRVEGKFYSPPYIE